MEVVMNFKKFGFLAAAGFATMFAGCTSNSDSSSPSGSENYEVPTIEVAECEEITDEAVRKDMDDAQETFINFIEAFSESDFKEAQKSAETIKKVYGKALKSNPGNCEAQLGYALATITNLLNNKSLNDVIDTINVITNGSESDEEYELPDVVALHKLGASEASQLIVKASSVAKSEGQKVITDRLQDAIADDLIPAVDTASIYLESIAKNADFKMTLTVDDKKVEIDQSVTAPALGGIYVLRAVLTALASFNIDFSKDGKYDWIDSLMNLNTTNYKDNVGAQYAVELLSYDNPFGTVKEEWKKRYLKIPEDLQKAITYVNMGFQYKLDAVENGASQKNALYVVGDDEDADISVDDLETVMDTLEVIKDALGKGSIKVKLSKDVSVKVNLGKFFELTSDIKAYSPYYEMVQPQDWFIIGDDVEWGDESDFVESYAAYYTTSEVENTVRSAEGVVSTSAYIDENEDGFILSVYAEYDEGSVFAEYSIELKDCEVNFTELSYDVEAYDDNEFEPAKLDFGEVFTLDNDMCKTKDGEDTYALSTGDIIPNVFNFTDKKGKVTASFTDIATGKVSMDELKDVVVFPDYTFGGMLVGMTESEFWSDFEKLFLNDDEEDD